MFLHRLGSLFDFWKVSVTREGNAGLPEPPAGTPEGGKVFGRLGPGRAEISFQEEERLHLLSSPRFPVNGLHTAFRSDGIWCK